MHRPSPLRVALVVLGFATPVAGQLAPDTARTLSEIQEGIKVLSQSADLRRVALAREAETVRALATAADSISTFATSASYSQALRHFDDARRAALPDPALPEPFSSAVDDFGQLLGRPPAGASPLQVKARAFLIVGRLQEQLAQDTEAAHLEVQVLQQLSFSLSQIQNGLRNAALEGLKASIRAQRLPA